ncbi:MAG: hypothetical protein JXR77_13930 [Lentisphaeria bacterium]|nr:hypothetical protein [Lentisphaeria bacterium]
MSDMTGLGTGRMIEKGATAVAVECVRATRALYRILRDARREGGLAEAIEAGPEALERILVGFGYRFASARKYARCVWRFYDALGRPDLAHLRDDDVVSYLAYLCALGRGNATLRLHLCAIRAVFDGLMELGITTGMRHVPRPRQRPPATREEALAVLRACATSRERFIVGQLTGTGIMPGQLCILGIPEIPPVPVPGEETNSAGAAEPHPASLGVFPADASGIHWLLPSPKGRGPISTRTLRRIVRRIVARVAAGAGVHVTCTALRKAGPVALPASA